MNYTRLLKRGSRGEDVKAVQRALHCYPDGIFGELTEEAVKCFQKGKGLTADGIVGERTWASFFPVGGSSSDLKQSKRKITLIVVHCTGTEEGKDVTVQAIRNYHVNHNGWRDIGYHYVIYRDGSLHEGRDVNISGGHARGYNSNSIGIVYVGGCPKGHLGQSKDTRTAAQKATLVRLLKDMRRMYPQARIVGHKDLNKTSCPGFDAKTEYKDL